MAIRGARRWTSVLLVIVAGTVLGCRSGDIVCAGTEVPAIQVRVVNGLTGAVIADATVTARYFIGGEEGDATVFMLLNSRGEVVPSFGGAPGVYEVTVRKSGYVDVVQRVTVQGTGGQCSEAITVDLTVSLFPVR